MNHYHIIQNGINNESATELLNMLNQTEKHVVVGLNSGGGANSVRCYLQKALEANKDRVTLVAMVGVYSAAFELFYRFTGKKALTDGVVGMWHLAALECRFNSKGEPDGDEAKAMFKGTKQGHEKDRKFSQSFMLPEELDAYDRGEDVYFDFERMKEIFPDAEIWD